ncbi:hypothetical protein ACT7DH_15845 [Bacillus pacificus]
MTSIPPTGFIENEGIVSFQYQPDPTRPPVFCYYTNLLQRQVK